MGVVDALVVNANWIHDLRGWWYICACVFACCDVIVVDVLEEGDRLRCNICCVTSKIIVESNWSLGPCVEFTFNIRDGYLRTPTIHPPLDFLAFTWRVDLWEKISLVEDPRKINVRRSKHVPSFGFSLTSVTNGIPQS